MKLQTQQVLNLKYVLLEQWEKQLCSNSLKIQMSSKNVKQNVLKNAGHGATIQFS